MNKLRIATIGVLAAALLLPAVVFAQEGGPERPEGTFRAAGEITSVVPGQGTFTLTTRKGEELEYQTNDETKFRSPNGSVEDIHDLKKGMKAFVVAVEQDNGIPLALMVAAGHPEDLPDGKQLGGIIESINLDAQSFTLKPRDGDAIQISTGDRTRFRGEGMEGLLDLETGMHARVVAIEQDDGGLMALVVGVGNPEDRPKLDVTALGTVVDKGGNSFTIEKRNGEQISFSVGDETHYKGIGGFGDLQAGMMAAVGAKESSDGLQAVFVGARNPEDRPDRGSQDNPQDRPGRGPDPRGPGQGQGQDADVSA
jgi:hypothetical protein